MEIRNILACALFLLNVAVTYGKAMMGKHNQDCKTIRGLVTIELPNCMRSSIKLNQCFGTCLSWDGLPQNDGIKVSSCKCCKPVTFRDEKILVGCKGPNGNNVVQQHTVKEPIACSCSPCSRRRKRSKAAIFQDTENLPNLF